MSWPLARYFLLCCLLLPLQSTAQSLFQKQYALPGFQDINSMVEADNHDFVTLGEAQLEDGGPLFVFVTRTDERGNMLWKKYYGEPTYHNGTQILKMPDSYAILYHGDFIGTRIMTLDQNGEVIFPGVQPDSITYYGASFDRDGDNGFVMVAENLQKDHIHRRDIALLKLDLSGHVTWGKLYGLSELNERPVKVLRLADGSYLIVGTTTESAGIHDYENILILRIDNQGDVIWKKVLGGDEQNVPTDMIRTKDGAYVIISFNNGIPGILNITKIDEDGTILYDKPINGSHIGGPNKIAENVNGDLIVAGEGLIPFNTPPEPPRFTLLWGLSSDGELKWQREYRVDPRYSAGYVVINTYDDNYIVGGRVANNVNYLDTDFFLLKVGVDGCNLDPLSLGADTTTCSAPVNLDAGSGFDEYLWSTGSSNQSITANFSGAYWVRVTGHGSCSQSDTIQVAIKDCYFYDHCKNIGYDIDEIIIPNVITPNGDKWNERFVVPPSLTGSKLSIYNRWGSLVYSSENYK
jgi:hypothetical protein